MPKASSVPSVLDPRCPSRLVLDRIADKWTALVIQILAGGTMRYAALQREIGGISQKMLTQTLRSLERDGLVQRTVHPDRKSTRLNSSHVAISYAVFCLKKKRHS